VCAGAMSDQSLYNDSHQILNRSCSTKPNSEFANV
jgi:hypothetical protein